MVLVAVTVATKEVVMPVKVLVVVPGFNSLTLTVVPAPEAVT